MHTLNGDPNVAKLQQYTIELYKEIEAISGQSCGIHLPGGLMLADTPERMDLLRMAVARGRYLGMDLRADLGGGGQGAVPAARGEVLRRRARTTRSKATSTRTASPTPTPSRASIARRRDRAPDTG